MHKIISLQVTYKKKRPYKIQYNWNALENLNLYENLLKNFKNTLVFKIFSKTSLISTLPIC